MNRARLSAVGPGAALAALAIFQPWLEQRMWTHMLLEIPLLFALGWWLAPIYLGTGPRWLRNINASGLFGLTLGLAVTTIWMFPVALDAAVVSPMIGWVKVTSIVAAGWLARLSLRAAGQPVQAFFIINWAWMTATAGFLYQETPQRVCSTYLLADQAWTGIGLVVMAFMIVGTWMLLAFQRQPELEAVE